MDMKVCSKCGKEWPATLEYFQACNKVKSGLRSECKECTKKYYKENKNRILENSKKRYRENPQAKHEYDAIYRFNNLEVKHAKDREYYKKNSDNIKSHVAKWYKNNKQHVLKYQKQHQENNKDYYRDIKNICNHKRRAYKKQLPNSFNKNDWTTCKESFNHQCAYCGKHLKNLTQDHFIPISKGGEYTKNNIIPACGSCNYSKQDADFEIWYPQQPFYSPEREKKILDYLGYKDGVQQLSII
jgi:hypothetical protein